MTEITDNIAVRTGGWFVDRRARRRVGTALAVGVAGVWLVHGLYNKVLHGTPRHLLIVQSVPGLAGVVGEWVLAAVGVVEVMVAVWVLSGRARFACAAAQTVMLLAMNVVELTFARGHLLWPAGLVPVNLVFLAMAWAAAVLRERVRGTGESTPVASEGLPLTPALSRKGRGSKGSVAPGPAWNVLAPLYCLRRHPFPVVAHFRHCLVLTYALPAEVVEPLLPPGVVAEVVDGKAFLAVAMVQTEGLRPKGMPRWMGKDFFLTGYRVFVKYRTPEGRTLRGLRILRSDADRRLMVTAGNLLTHYNYRLADVGVCAGDGRLAVDVRTPGGEADLHVVAELAEGAPLPVGSPFADWRAARRFAGPLPWTFDYEAETGSVIGIRGERENWDPRPVRVRVLKNAFVERGAFAGSGAVLAAAFYVGDIDYLWRRGVRYSLGAAAEEAS